MRFIGMLLVLLIIGLLIYKQLGTRTELSSEVSELQSTSDIPKVPVNPNELEQFDKDMNQFMKDEAEKTAKALKEAEGQ